MTWPRSQSQCVAHAGFEECPSPKQVTCSSNAAKFATCHSHLSENSKEVAALLPWDVGTHGLGLSPHSPTHWQYCGCAFSLSPRLIHISGDSTPQSLWGLKARDWREVGALAKHRGQGHCCPCQRQQHRGLHCGGYFPPASMRQCGSMEWTAFTLGFRSLETLI